MLIVTKRAPKQIMDRRGVERPYLHPGFHGALCTAVKYLLDQYGESALREYFEQVGREVYAPLIAALKQRGLGALEEHWRKVFDTEGGQYEMSWDGDVLVLTVSRCPAVCYLLDANQLSTPLFCESTRWVNHAICQAAGYQCRVDYEPGQGRCVQRFWK